MPDSDEKSTPYVRPDTLAPTLDGAGLIAEACKRKERANEFFGMGLFDPAMQSYLTAIWYLKVARPSYPEVLSEQQPPSDTAASKHLGDGVPVAPSTPAKTPTESSDERFTRRLGYFVYSAGCAWLVALVAVMANAALAFGAAIEIVGTVVLAVGGLALWLGLRFWRQEEVPSGSEGPVAKDIAAVLEGVEARALRLALHLNVSACALKRNDWYLAREATRHVLAYEPEHPKGLYRLAQAWDGAGDLKEAGRALSTLLKIDGQRDNREARRLLADVQERRQRERAMYEGVCNKAGFCQTADEAAAMEARDAAAKRIKPKDALTQRFDAYAEYEKRRSLGFNWEEVGQGRPSSGREVSNKALMEALRERSTRTLTWVEMDKMGVEDIEEDHFVMVDGRRFEPRGRDWQHPVAVTEVRPEAEDEILEGEGEGVGVGEGEGEAEGQGKGPEGSGEVGERDEAGEQGMSSGSETTTG